MCTAASKQTHSRATQSQQLVTGRRHGSRMVAEGQADKMAAIDEHWRETRMTKRRKEAGGGAQPVEWYGEGPVRLSGAGA